MLTYFAIKSHVEKKAVHVGANKVRADEMRQTEAIQLTPRQKLVVIIN